MSLEITSPVFPGTSLLDRCAKASASPRLGEAWGGGGRRGGDWGRRGRWEEKAPTRLQDQGPVGPANTKPIRSRQQQPNVPHPGGVRGVHPHTVLPLSAVSHNQPPGRRRQTDRRETMKRGGGRGRQGGRGGDGGGGVQGDSSSSTGKGKHRGESSTMEDKKRQKLFGTPPRDEADAAVRFYRRGDVGRPRAVRFFVNVLRIHLCWPFWTLVVISTQRLGRISRCQSLRFEATFQQVRAARGWFVSARFLN